MPPSELGRLGEIDRSERVTEAYEVTDGKLRCITFDWDIPNWDPVGDGRHSLTRLLETWQPVVDGDGVLLGIERSGGLAGLSIFVPRLEPAPARLAFMHVSRANRSRGVAPPSGPNASGGLAPIRSRRCASRRSPAHRRCGSTGAGAVISPLTPILVSSTPNPTTSS